MARFHSYVSADPSVSISGTPAIRQVRPDAILAATPRLCLRAVAAASRNETQRVARRGPLRDAAIQLSADVARNPYLKIEKEFQVDERTIRRVLNRKRNLALEVAARLLLSDPRSAPTQMG
jgi:hypothetical protein